MHVKNFSACDGIYMLNHSVGRPPLSARDAAHAGFFNAWDEGSPELWNSWLAEIDRFRQALATSLGGKEDNYCPQTNLSSALTKILGALPRDPARNVLVYTAADFPSMGFVLSMAEKAGFELRCIPADSDFGSLDPWATAIDDATAFVLVTHVHSNTSRQIDVTDVCSLARGHGAMTVVDVAQSAGVVPIDVNDWNADFVVGSCVKFLCGGPGAGFVWINDSILAECEPTDVGWFSHANPFEFDIHNFRYAENAQKFWGGTPSVLPFVVAANSIELLTNIGIEAIRSHSLALTRELIEIAGETNVVTPLEDDHRGGTVVLHFGDKQENVLKALQDANVYFDVRPTGIRLSPHIYTSDKEIETVRRALSA